jgi:hypothetical protein
MKDKVEIHTKERELLMDVVFGPEGLADADKSVVFEEKSTQVVDEINDHPSLCNYFEKQMKPRIQSFVTAPRRNQREIGEQLCFLSRLHLYTAKPDLVCNNVSGLVSVGSHCVHVGCL